MRQKIAQKKLHGCLTQHKKEIIALTYLKMKTEKMVEGNLKSVCARKEGAHKNEDK